MKRLIMLAVLCAFVLSAAAASASELKANGYFKGDATWQKNWDFTKGNENNYPNESRTFNIVQRTEFSLEFIASENLKSVFTIRSEQNWGQVDATDGKNSSVDSSSTDLRVRKAYLDFMWPGTDVAVKVGFQGIALPNAVAGSLILDSRATALIVSKPITDNFALTGAYVRAAQTDDALSQFDAYALIADITAGDVNVKPFVVLANTGENVSNKYTNFMGSANGTATPAKIDGAYWLGVSATANVAGVGLAGDINYGNVSGDEEYADRSGYAFLVSADYAMDMMTPEAFFVYTSGEDDDDTNGSERMPQINGDYAIGSFFFGGEAWLSSVGTSGDFPLGFWALGLSLKDIASFTEGMYHIVHVIYGKGTNDKDSGIAGVGSANYGSVLTEEDSVIELDFNTYYKVYDELTIGLELGYVNLNADEDVWGADGGSAYKVSTGLKYSF